METVQNNINARKDPPMSFDSFCDDISKEFARDIVKDKVRYMGMYIYANGNLSQAELNLFRENIARRLGLELINCPVIAGTAFPTTFQKYEDTFGKRENGGWYVVDVGDFIRKGALLI